jgi:cytochrome c5
MKKMFLFLGVVALMLGLTSVVLLPAKPKSTVATVTAKTNAIPDDVMAVFKNSCMGCHATGGKKMAMSMLNFSEWDMYKPEKQAKKAAAICKIVTKGAMPPKAFRKSHPDAVPTPSQKDLICKWSNTLASTK